MRAHIPNALSLSRIALAIVVLALSGHLTVITYSITLGLVIFAITTDFVDGALARRWRVTSELGYVLDGLGDRAIHVALLLVFLVRYGVHPVLVWLLIFRDIGIYAARVLSKEWMGNALGLRRGTLLQVGCLQVWIGLFLVRDGLRVFTNSDPFHSVAFDIVQYSLLCIAIIVSYYGLFRSFGFLIDHDHDTLKH